MNESIELLKKKAQYYFEKKQAVHITLQNREFYNGNMIKCEADFILMDVWDKGEIPVFFIEIFDIEIYTARVEDGNNEV